MKTKKVFKILLIIGIVVAVALFFIFDLDKFLTLENIQEQRGKFLQFYQENRYQTILVYFFAYVFVTAFSLPGALIMTLLGGGMFGLITGTIVISLASTIGATLAFLMSRFLFKEAIQNRYGSKLEAINQGIEKEGIFYLFTLRLVPLFPFFLINILMGLTPIRTIQFFLVSWIGMFSGTVAFVFAGTEISKIESTSGILSPRLILAFSIIGILPLIMKRIVNGMRSRKLLKGFKKPKHFDYNICVIGGGSAGLVSAYIGAAVKAKVALVEKHKMGGDCLNTGCVPSKALLRTAKILNYATRSKDFGIESMKADFKFQDVMKRVHKVINIVEPHDSVERYQSLGVDCYQDEATIVDPYRVKIGEKEITTKNIIVATGARPFVPPIPGLQEIPYLTSDNLWNLTELPKKLLVLGGGPIGCELAQCFNRLGSEVTQVEMMEILNREDPDVREYVSDTFQNEGIKVLAGHRAKEFIQRGEEQILICEYQGKDVEISFDTLLVAIGRKANVTGFGLEGLGVEISKRGTIEVDPFLRTNYPNIFACGDVAGPYQFTHTAAHQAWYAAVNSLFTPLKNFKVDYRVIPWTTFTDPEIARVGLNEMDAKQNSIKYEVTKYGLDDLDRAIADSENHGFVKVLTQPGKDKILGVTIVGHHAGEVIPEFILAMKHGLGLNKILGTIHTYPTWSEANKYAAGNWKKAHVSEKLLNFLEKFHRWFR